MKQRYPAITIADTTVLFLLTISGIYLYIWYNQEQLRFLILGFIQLLLGIIQYKLNRADILF